MSDGKMIVTMDGEEGSLELTYKVDGDTLTMDDPSTGKPLTLTRAK